jgi:hypothetical protein
LDVLLKKNATGFGYLYIFFPRNSVVSGGVFELPELGTGNHPKQPMQKHSTFFSAKKERKARTQYALFLAAFCQAYADASRFASFSFLQASGRSPLDLSIVDRY